MGVDVMDRWMGGERSGRDLIVRERLEALRSEAARDRLAGSSRAAHGRDRALRVRVGMALVRAGTALAGERAVARLLPRHS